MRSVLQYTRVSTCLSSHRSLLIGLLLALPSVFSVAAATETLNFIIKATVVNPSCSVVTEDLNQTINMPDIDTGQLESSGQTQPIFFTVRLEKCGSNTNAKLKFSSTTDNGKGYFYPTKSDRGFVLGFTDKDGVEIPLGNEQSLSLQLGNNTLQFGVKARRDSGTLVPGSFEAMATATITYQ
ncbi:fimbrial protein [Aeromonas piscicola]